ncbi:MAG: hypothetical protein IJS82_02725 [Paludibacteraceae bacterium]|nr:hypothetical protein [Paludibacteraceae bacterium]
MKTIKYLSFTIIGTLALLFSACEPKALTKEDVLMDETSLQAELTKLNPDGYQIYNINSFLDKYMTEDGNFKSDSSVYRTRSTYGTMQLFSIDTLPVNGPGIYLRGRVATDDYGGNFYKSLVIQQVNDWETAGNPTIDQQCLRISLDLGSANGMYPQGQELLIRCNGLAVGRYANQPQLCVPSYNNNIWANHESEKVGWAPGRIPSAKFRSNTRFLGEPDMSKLVYETLTLAEMQTKYLAKYADVEGARKLDGRLVKLTNVHFNGKYADTNNNAQNCNRYKADSTELGNPELDENACTFGPTTKNVGYPQSRYVEDGANKVLVSTSEYSRYAYYYLPAAKYVGSVTGILSYYMDNGKYSPDGGEWAVSPCNLWDILPECQDANADPLWTPTEWKKGTPQPED